MWTYIYILSASLKKKRLCEIKKKIKVKYGDALSIIDVQTKYGDPRLYGNRDTDLIMKTISMMMKMRSSLGNTYLADMYHL